MKARDGMTFPNWYLERVITCSRIESLIAHAYPLCRTCLSVCLPSPIVGVSIHPTDLTHLCYPRIEKAEGKMKLNLQPSGFGICGRMLEGERSGMALFQDFEFAIRAFRVAFNLVNEKELPLDYIQFINRYRTRFINYLSLYIL